MKIAVTSQNFRTVTGHAGHARRFLIFDAEPGYEPLEVEQLLLPKELVMHEFRGDGPHPVDGVEVILSAGFGEGFAQRMAARGIIAVRTEKTDPAAAVTHYLECLAAGLDLPTGATCDCGHDHSHGHAHDHDHDHDLDHDHEHHDCGCGAAEMNEDDNRLNEKDANGEKRNE
jgi:predicted Fe-Mo cluster-binding NifX family protein